MRRVKVIFNPQSNHGRNARVANELRLLSERLGGADWSDTTAPGAAVDLAVAAGIKGYETVVAIGGDGTVHEVVNGLMKLEEEVRPSLCIVPVGSGNDFVRGARVTVNAFQALEHAFQAETGNQIDVGSVSLGTHAQQYWINALGIGFDAAVTLQSKRLTRLSGSAMYFIAALRTIVENYEAVHMDMVIDDVAQSRDVLMLTIGNGPREGGGFITTPASTVDDGLLDYALVAPVSRPMMLRLIPEVMRGTHGRFSQVRIGAFRTMRLLADRPLLVHSDGELIALHQDKIREMEIAVIPGALHLIV